MQRITVEVRDFEKAEQLYNVLQALDFVTRITADKQYVSQAAVEEKNDLTKEFFSYAGMWSGKDISVETLRQKAWQRQSV